MKQYIDLCKEVIYSGYHKAPARSGMPSTRSIHAQMMKFNLADGFPLLTTKKMFTRGILVEMLWMLSGSMNIHYLLKNNVHIWDGDGYKFFKKRFPNISMSKEEWIEHCSHTHDEAGYMGHIYGYQWRKRDGVDQIVNVLKAIKQNPNSRYHIVEAWNPKDVVSGDAALPPCHKQWQFFVHDNVLDLAVYCRSQDLPLGTPFNIAMYAFILHLFAYILDMNPGTLTWFGGDVHIYENQIDAILEQCKRSPRILPTLKFIDMPDKTEYFNDNVFDFDGFLSKITPSNFKIENYNPHPAIKIPLSVGN